MREFKYPGKWVLAGEHSVLRGGKAIAFPLSSCHLKISYSIADKTICQSPSYLGDAAQKVFLALKEKLSLPFSISFSVESNIPASSGLGSSAALCCALTEIAVAEGFLPRHELTKISTAMENIFHGISSGMDIAAVSAQAPICFQRGHAPATLRLSWQPHFYLHATSGIGNTKDCIRLVEKNPQLEKIDTQMQSAVDQALAALNSISPNRLDELATAINKAESCFRDWGLINSSMQNKIDELKKAGALAVKPTGSGSGGFLLSLWQNEIAEDQYTLQG